MTTKCDLLKQSMANARANDLSTGQAAMPDDVRALVNAMKVGEYMSVELGRIEQATSLAALDLARGKAAAFLSSALIYEDLRGLEDWKLLDLHIDKRANARGLEIQAVTFRSPSG